MVAIQRRHEKIFGEPPNSPRPFIYRIGDKVVYCDVSQEVKNRRGETIHSTPNITDHEIEGIWRIFQRVVRDSGYSGKVVFDVWIDGWRYRLVEDRPGSRIKSSRFTQFFFEHTDRSLGLDGGSESAGINRLGIVNKTGGFPYGGNRVIAHGFTKFLRVWRMRGSFPHGSATPV